MTQQPQPAAPRPQAAPASAVCPSCGNANRNGARFCSRCGQGLQAVLPPILTLVEPVGARWEYPLAKRSILIGRPHGRLPVDLDLGYYDDQGYVSRNHARLVRVGRRFQIMDLQSSNGTKLNGHALTPGKAYWLRQGDKIKMGRVVLQLRFR